MSQETYDDEKARHFIEISCLLSSGHANSFYVLSGRIGRVSLEPILTGKLRGGNAELVVK